MYSGAHVYYMYSSNDSQGTHSLYLCTAFGVNVLSEFGGGNQDMYPKPRKKASLTWQAQLSPVLIPEIEPGTSDGMPVLLNELTGQRKQRLETNVCEKTRKLGENYY